MYAWYRRTEQGLIPVLLDRGTVPALDRLLERTLDTENAELAAGVAAGFRACGRRRDHLRAVIRLALDFWTWRRLKDEGLDDAAAADLITEIATGLGASVPQDGR